MDWMWTWGGKSFGYRDGDDLWTQGGKHVGRFNGDEVYGPNGEYLGEVMSENRLITNRAKSGWRSFAFTPYGRRSAYSGYAGYAGYAMYAGHQDFPPHEAFD